MILLDFAKVSMMTEFMILGIDHIFTVGFELEGKWLHKRGFFKNDIEIVKQLIVTFKDTTGGSHPLVILVLNHFPEDYYDYNDTDDLMKTDTYILDQLEKHIDYIKQLVRYNQVLKEDKKNENAEVDDMIKRIRDIDEIISRIIHNITNDERLMELLFRYMEKDK